MSGERSSGFFPVTENAPKRFRPVALGSSAPVLGLLRYAPLLWILGKYEKLFS